MASSTCVSSSASSPTTSSLTSRGLWQVLIDLRHGGDWSLDLCFAGLSKNGLSVLDVPYRDKHREWWDVIEGRRTPDWGLERRTLGFVEGMEDDRRSVVPNETELVTLGILKKRGEIGRVWLDERMESFQKYRELGLDRTDARVVVVAGHDRFWNHSPEFVAALYGDRLEAMLLDNWYPRYVDLPFKARRIGWSCNFDHYWSRPELPPEKDIDVSFIGYNSHPDRARYIDFIRRTFPDLRLHLVLETEPDSFNSFVPKSQYFDVIQRSRIALNLRGAADRGKTMRAYEIPYVGSFMLSQAIEDPGMAEDFVEGEHCWYFRSEEELATRLNFLMTGDGLKVRTRVAANGHLRAIGDLGVKARWADVLGWLEEPK